MASVAAIATARAEDVNITSNAPAGVNLDTYVGSTARIFPGVTVSNGISATTQAWTVTNDGAVNGGNTVTLNQGGTFANSAGATVNGTATAITFGYKPFALPPAGGPGLLNNYGTIAGAVEGVTMWLGGTVNNYQGGIISTTGSGNAVSVGQGTSRTVINSGEIHADKTTGFSTGILVQGGPATITNTATGVITGGYNGVYASATTPLTFTNNGAIASVRGPAVEAAGGGTFINTGTIQSGVDGMLISAAATITNSGTIGSTGAGRAIVFSGSAIHTLNLSTGSVLGGNVQGGTATDNLVLQGTGTESIAKFLSFETLSMQGADWTLNGTGAFTTSAQIQSGALRVNGQLTTPALTVAAGGTLTGNGTVVGDVTSTGTTRVDSGVLTINGNFVNNGGVFNVGVTPASSGKLGIIGAGHTATLNGGTVQVNASTGQYALNTIYTILSASGGLSGTFAGATSNFAFLAPTVTYDLNNVYLTLDRNAIDFAGIGGTPNQRAAGRGVEGLGYGNTIYNTVLLMTAPQALGAFDQLSGEIHATAQRSIFDDLHFVRDAILGRLRGAGAATSAEDGDGIALGYAKEKSAAKQAAAIFPAAPNAPVYSTWGQAYGSRGRADGDGNAAALSADRAGLITGLEIAFDRERRIGVAFGASETRLDVADRMSNATINSYHAAFYGGMRFGAFGLRGGASLTWNDLHTRRTIAFPGFADATTANYSGVTGQVFGEVGYRFNVGGTIAEPFGGLAHIALRTDPFSETGGAAALGGLGGTQQTTFSTLGLRVAREMTAGPLPLAAHASAGWRHIIAGDTTPTAALAFTGAAPSFVVAGVPLGVDTAVLDGGLDVALSRAATVGLAYNGQFAAGAAEHAVKGLWRYRF